MAHFAKLNENDIVTEVNVIDNSLLIDESNFESEQKGIEFLIQWSNGHSNWVQTSYNANFRKNYAAIGDKYDRVRDAFIPPKPYPSWVLDENTCLWHAPLPYPSDAEILDAYIWNEEKVCWEEYNKDTP